MDQGRHRQGRTSAGASAVAKGIALGLLAAGPAGSADKQYASESACLRAESPEFCARQFPPPPPPPVQSLPLAACTEMMHQAGIIAMRATTFAQLEDFDKVRDLTRQFLAVADDAFACEKNARPASNADTDAWNEARSETHGKYEVLQSVVSAATK